MQRREEERAGARGHLHLVTPAPELQGGDTLPSLWFLWERCFLGSGADWARKLEPADCPAPSLAPDLLHASGRPQEC